MSFAPIIPSAGYTGWRFLQNTLTNQKEAFARDPQLQRDLNYFRDNIGQAKTADDLTSDRRLLRVALGAFGLEDDLNNTFFIHKILSDGTDDKDALANKLADKRYAEFSKALGFNSAIGPKTQFALFTDDILNRYQDKQFERAVGDVDGDMRLAMNLASGLADITDKNGSDKAAWFSVMGNPPLRRVFETAFGMPKGFGALDIDLQLGQFQRRAKSVFGTDQVADIATPDNQEKLVRLFLVRSQAAQFNATTNSAQMALMLLGGT